MQSHRVGGLSRVWKNALSITPNRVSISFITAAAEAEPADSLNITVLLREQPILRHGSRAFCVQGKLSDIFHKFLQCGAKKFLLSLVREVLSLQLGCALAALS